MGQTLGGAAHLIAAAIIQGNRQMQLVIFSGHQFKIVHHLDQGRLKAHAIPDETHPHPCLDQGLGFTGQIPPEQAHEARNFCLGALPVFGRKGENRQVFYT